MDSIHSMMINYFSPKKPETESSNLRSSPVDDLTSLVASPKFETITLEQLGSIKRGFRVNELPFEDPSHVKIDAAITKYSMLERRKVNRKWLNKCKTTLLTENEGNNSSIFVQNNLTIDETKKEIKNIGKNWTTLVLNNIDDMMMEMIVDSCPQLTCLKIVISGKQNPGIFSNFGLSLIASIKQLISLELNFLYGTRIGSGDFLDLFAKAHLQQNIVNLSVTTDLIGDAHLVAMGKFSNLTSLAVSSGFFTANGVNQFLQSTSIKNTIEEFNVLGGTVLFDKVGLEALSRLPKLMSVTLNGKWDTSDQNVISFLKAKPNLSILGLSGYPISQDIMNQIATMSSLRNLALGNCSRIINFDGLVQNLRQMNVLLLDSAVNFKDSDFGYMAKWEKLTSLSLLGVYGLDGGFVFFCNSPFMAKSLKSFHFSGMNAVTSSRHFGLIGKLSSLTTLRLENLSYFNDTSMEIMSKLPIAAGLEALELNNVSIDFESIRRLALFKELKTLMVANCHALTERATRLFVNSPALQEQLSKLYLEGVSFNDETLKCFNNFKNLVILCLCNLEKPASNNKTLKQLWKLPTMVKNNTIVELGSDGLVPFEEFVNGQV